MGIYSFEQKQLRRSCEIFGRLFKLSLKKGYSSRDFIKQVMTYKGYEKLLSFDEGQEWCDEYFLMACFEEIKPFKTGKDVLDDFELWFIGYLYRYWVKTRDVDSKYVYSLLPVDEFDKNFGFYHTQGWDYIIEDVLSHKD